jgi:hypothetical protein
MALITRDLGGFNDSQVLVQYTFDDTSGLVTDVTTVNNGDKGTLSYTLTDPNTNNTVFNTPATVNAKTGTVHHNVSVANVHLVFEEGTGRAAGSFGWDLPYRVDLTWSSQ